MREGLRLLFKGQSDTEVLETKEVSEALVQLALELKPDVVVIDINMSQVDSIELVRQILNETPGVKMVALSGQLHIYILEQAVKAGFSGFMLKECCFNELAHAVRAVHANQTYMCRQIKDILANGYLSQLRSDYQGEPSALSDKEYEIIRLLSLGMTSKEIAFRMEISSKTVDAYRRQIMNKLDINSIAELIKYAIKVGITSV